MSTLTGIGKDTLARVVAADIPPGSFGSSTSALGCRPRSPTTCRRAAV
jgi:hypothetical protein